MVTIDGSRYFSECEYSIVTDSSGRESIERSVGGLDGAVSVDLGKGVRKIRQRGFLRGRNSAELCGRVRAIEGLMDGKEHEVRVGDGRVFGSMKAASCRFGEFEADGIGFRCDYEIVYMQLRW